MKKLLILLSVLTISGTAVPTTIAASPYQKDKLENINLLQSNSSENLIRNKRENKNNISGIITKFIAESGSLNSFGLVLNNKIYSGSFNGKVYEYDTETGQQKIVINTQSGPISSGVALNNKIYFGSTDFKVYEYDTETGQQKIVINTQSAVYSSGVALNNKVYFGSYDFKVYEYNPATGQQKVIITTNGNVKSSGVVLNNKLYFGSGDHKVYEYNPATGQQKVVINAQDWFTSSGVALNNKVYFSSHDHKVYEYNPATGQQKVVINTQSGFFSDGVALNNKIYFGSTDFKVYEYDTETGQQKVVINTQGGVSSDGVVLNNRFYFFAGVKLYEYNPATGQQKTIMDLTNNQDWVSSNGLILNNMIYFAGNNTIYGYSPLELNESTIINISDQIKKGLYLYYKKQNPNSEIKNISNINLKNLTVSNVTIEQTQKNKSSNLEQDLNDVCKDSNSTFINNSNIEQTQNTVSCSKQLTETNTFQKMNGFSKSETTSNTDNWSANVNTKITTKASGSAGIPLVAEGKVEVAVEVGGGYTWGGSKTYTVGDTSNSSDTEIKTTTNTTTITVPSQPVKVPPHSKISISVTSWQNNIRLILNYYQKVEGMVSADFIDQNNSKSTISISIKDAMLNLLENNILPSKIKINDDNSINFSYDIKTEKQIIMHQTEIGEAIPLNLDEKI